MPLASRPERFPWWLRTLDILTVVSLLVSLNVFLTGGFREWTPFGRFSMTSWVRPLLIAAVVLLVRHALRPRPVLPIQIFRSVRDWWRVSEARIIWPLAVSTRIGILVVGFLAVVLVGYPPKAPPWDVYGDDLLDLPARWDTGWYLMVAMDGYQWRPSQGNRQQNIAFFPVYPLAMRYTALLAGRQTMWVGVLISLVAFFFASIYLFRLARQFIGDDAAVMSVALLASYPFALFFSTAYTESLFLLTVVAACYHFERDELWQAAMWGLIAGLTRPNGCLLSIVLGLIALRPLFVHGWRPVVPPPTGWPRLADRIATAAAPGIGMLIYSTYIFFLTGNPLQWAEQNAAWGRVYRSLDALVTDRIHWISESGFYEYASTRTLDMLQAMAVIFVLVSVWPVFRRFGLAYAAMILVNVLPPLAMGGLLSMGRVTSVLFPTFLWLAVAIPQTHRFAWIAAFAMMQAVCAILFFTWRPLY
jgi:hypothetical protein